jgi:ABC-type glycerol-3-phosphate transport system substrate-binding protein
MQVTNFMKRLILAVLMTIVLASGSAWADKTLTLLTWNAPQNEPMFRSWMDEFKEAHPDVSFNWLDKKGSEWAAFYQTQLVGKTPPDIVNIQSTLWAEYAAKKYLLDLTPLLEKEPNVRDRFNAKILSYWKMDGRVYGLPYAVNKSLLYYNKKLFKKAGLSRPPQNFDELIDYAYKIGGLSDETTGFLTLNFDWLYWPLFAMNGIEFFTPDMGRAAFNTAKTAEVVKRLAKATSDGAINKIAWTGRWREPNSAFASGNVGANFPGGWGVFNSSGFLISRATTHPELAWEFVKQITNNKWALGTAKRIVRTTGNKDADASLLKILAKEDPVGLDVMTAQVSHLDKLTATWKTPLDAKIKQAFWPDLQSALLGQKDPQEALDDAERKVNRVLKRGR